jgi:hypothetical protein
MSGPFSPVAVNGQPLWTVQPSLNGNFSIVNVGGGTTIPEVGYGEGGYGQDGYDAPAINLPSASAPIWTVETDR